MRGAYGGVAANESLRYLTALRDNIANCCWRKKEERGNLRLPESASFPVTRHPLVISLPMLQWVGDCDLELLHFLVLYLLLSTIFHK